MMHAFATRRIAKPTGSSDTAELLVWAINGMVMGAGVVLFSSLVQALLLFLTQMAAGMDDSISIWPPWAVVATGVASAVISFVIGWWLFDMRHAIGPNVAERATEGPEYVFAKRRRRYFTFGAMLAYVPFSIALWVFFVGVANTIY